MTIGRLAVLLNAAAGSVDETDIPGERRRIADAFAAVAPDVDVDVEAVAPARMARQIERVWQRSPRPDAIVVAGGDGTVGNAAGAAAGTDIVIGVLPRGTFDHFATDLGMPGDLAAAAAALVDGEIRRVDVGEVNGRVFVNNSLLGLYPHMVAIRDRVMDERGWGKVRAVPLAAARVLGTFPTHRFDLHGPDGFERRQVRTPLVFVGNGVYEPTPGAPPRRTRLDAGVLGVQIARSQTRWQLVRGAAATLTRGENTSGHLDTASLTTLVVHSHAKRVRVALDGEITWCTPPLRYRIRPGDLRVLAPRDPEAAR